MHHKTHTVQAWRWTIWVGGAVCRGRLPITIAVRKPVVTTKATLPPSLRQPTIDIQLCEVGRRAARSGPNPESQYVAGFVFLPIDGNRSERLKVCCTARLYSMSGRRVGRDELSDERVSSAEGRSRYRLAMSTCCTRHSWAAPSSPFSSSRQSAHSSSLTEWIPYDKGPWEPAATVTWHWSEGLSAVTATRSVSSPSVCSVSPAASAAGHHRLQLRG